MFIARLSRVSYSWKKYPAFLTLTTIRQGVLALALSSSERNHKEPLAHLPTALRPSRPVHNGFLIKHKRELTTLPWLRYSSGHRKGRLKILSIISPNRSPNIGRPLFDEACVASSSITSHCSANTPAQCPQ